MDKPLRLGIAGLGTVGAGVLKILERNRELINARAGRPVTVTAVSARNRGKDRGVDISALAWEDNPVALATRGDVDVVLELMGGSEGPAKATVEAAIAAGRDVVTANKALLALHGPELAEAAEKAGVVLRFEAAVAGGIPVIKALTEGLSANRVGRVLGVMNGTCNYMLTRMEREGLDYTTVFEEARRLGYLEADPSLDVGGIDAAHKLALLAAIAFGVRVPFADTEIDGIERVTIEDIRRARDLGFRIKLLGVAEMAGERLSISTAPCLVPADSPLGMLEGATNMVVLEGDAVERISLSGPGAGEGPTASAVLADVIDIARGFRQSTYGRPVASLTSLAPTGIETPRPWYLRLVLADRPGALARVAGVLGEEGISIDRMRQYGHEAPAAPVLIVTHPAPRARVDAALARLPETGVAVEEPVAFRIETA